MPHGGQSPGAVLWVLTGPDTHRHKEARGDGVTSLLQGTEGNVSHTTSPVSCCPSRHGTLLPIFMQDLQTALMKVLPISQL